MLRAQAFEGFLTLVPILLVAVISIFLRARAARRRKQREEAARDAEGPKSSVGAPSAGTGLQSAHTRGESARGAQARAPGGPAAPKQARAATRAPQFPWQRETEDTTPASTSPFTPQQPGRAQVTARESYAYPPPLSLNDLKKSPADVDRELQGTQIPRPVLRPLAESRMAAARDFRLPDGRSRTPIDRAPRLPDGRSRMTAPREKQDLRERMEARAKAERTAVKGAAREHPSITTRLERLPPLKRAVIWAEILGPPGGRQ